MASTKVKAIVIGNTKLKEKDMLINLFTLEKGKMTVTMRGVRGDKAKLKSAKEIFCFGDFIVEEGKTNIVTAVDIIDNFYEISKNIERYYEGCAILDIVSKIVTESNPQLFVEVIKSLKTLCYDNPKKYYVIDKFLLSVFNAMGYGFLNDKCSSCGSNLEIKYMNYEVGEIVCPACHNSLCEKISDACFSAMRLLDKTDYEKLSTVKLGGMGEIQAFNLLNKNYQFRTGYSCNMI